MTRALAIAVLVIASRVAAEPERAAFHGRLDLSQTLSDDGDTARQLLFTDLRAVLEGNRFTSAELGFRLDGRGRWSWTSTTDARLFVSDAYVRLGSPEARWRFRLGRQTMRVVASAQADGLSAEHAFTPALRGVAFAGLMPHPVTNLPTVDFTTAGAGYEYLGATAQHSGGLAVSLYRLALDRLYLTHRTTVLFSPSVALSTFLLGDLSQPQGLVPLNGTAGPDLTSALVLLRLRPARVVDLSLSAAHQHTILPGHWWADWMNEELRRRGFVIDGVDPVGTRVTTLRLTANLPVTRALVPFARLRFDLRHTGPATGAEAIGGVKVRPGKAFVLVQGGWRRAFAAQVVTASTEAGYEGELLGVQGGASWVYRTALEGTDGRHAFEGHAMAWLDFAELASALKGTLLSAQYQLMLDSGFLYQVGVLQLGYRF